MTLTEIKGLSTQEFVWTHLMFFDWVTGQGPATRYFGGDHSLTHRLRTSPGIDKVRQTYCDQIAKGDETPVKGSTLEKANASLQKFGIEKFFGVKNRSALESALEQSLKLGLKSKDAVILATAKAQGTALATKDKAIITAAGKVGVEIISR